MTKIDQMAIKFTNIFNWKALKNLLKFGFLVCKYTIWQPCSQAESHLLSLRIIWNGLGVGFSLRNKNTFSFLVLLEQQYLKSVIYQGYSKVISHSILTRLFQGN
jgi:hypothetical protein